MLHDPDCCGLAYLTVVLAIQINALVSQAMFPQCPSFDIQHLTSVSRATAKMLSFYAAVYDYVVIYMQVIFFILNNTLIYYTFIR